jgi:hypothetical protein
LRRATARIGFYAGLLSTLFVAPASAQQSISDVLSFLVTNRSVPTGDFQADAQAAAATRDAISGLLLTEIATLPISASAGGFTYRLHPELGTVSRSSNSFGPFFTERTLTSGRGRASFGFSYQSARFSTIDGRSLTDGTLVSTASTLRGNSEPFDVETMSLHIGADTMAAVGTIGVTDRLDVSVAVPIVRVTISGQRIDNYRGEEVVQAIGSGSASGLGDIVLRAKYNVLRGESIGVAVGGETRLPTGSQENLRGAGDLVVKPRLMASVERERVTAHADIGYALGGVSDVFDYNGAITLIAGPRVTVIGEILGRRVQSVGRLAALTAPHPQLAGVDTIRLTSISEAAQRVVAVAGLKWNVAGAWILSANIVRPVTAAGLNAEWVPTASIDYAFGR